METTAFAQGTSSKKLWTGRVLSALGVLFLLFDSIIKIVQAGPAIEGSLALGWPASTVLAIGLVELSCVLVYLYPRTSYVGAVLLTGFLGGAITTHARIDSPLLTHTAFPLYIAALIWGGLLLRDDRRVNLSPARA